MVKTKTKTYSMSDMARVCDVSVASISILIKKHGLKPVKTGESNAKLFSDADFQKIQRYYQHKPNKQAKTQTTTKDELIEQLKKENAYLKSQIAIKDKQIETASMLADQAQKLDLANLSKTALPQPKPAENVSHGVLWRLLHNDK